MMLKSFVMKCMKQTWTCQENCGLWSLPGGNASGLDVTQRYQTIPGVSYEELGPKESGHLRPGR